MQTLPFPPGLHRVLQRRVNSASSALQQQAFGASPIRAVFYRSEKLAFVLLGGAEFRAEAEKMNKRYGTPLPGIGGTERKGELLRLHEGSRGSAMIGGGLTADNAAIELGRDTSFFLSMVPITLRIFQGQRLSYKVPGALVAGLGQVVTESSLGEELETFLVRYLANFVERTPYAADNA